MKNKLVCILLIMISFILSACVSTSMKNNDLGVKEFKPHYKQDVHFAAGKKTAEKDGFIYYFSTEGGTPGIYSMRTDGTEVLLRVPVADIRKLQIVGDDIYYLACFSTETNPNGAYEAFRLYRYNLNDHTTTNVMDQTLYQNINPHYLNLGDFYVTDSGMIVNACIQWLAPRNLPSLALYCVDENGEILNDQCRVIVSEADLSMFTEYASTTWTLSELKDIVISSDILPITFKNDLYDSTKGGMGYSNKYFLSQPLFSVTDKAKNTVAIKMEEPFSYSMGGLENRVVQSFNQHGIITTEGGGVLILHNDFEGFRELDETMIELVDLPNQEKILFLYDAGDRLYIVSEQENRQQCVFVLDLSAGELTELYRCTNSEKILALDSRKMVTAQNKEITVWYVNEESLKPYKRIAVEETIVQSGKETDVAGDWLFIYKSGDDKNCDELLGKVYIGFNEAYGLG